MKSFALILVLVCLSVSAVWASGLGLFTWPTNVALTGPYALLSGNDAIVFQPNAGPPAENDMATHQFSHHTRISWYQGATYIATSSAGTNEEDGGMQCALYISTNRGSTWTAPIQVIPSQSLWTNVPFGARANERVTYPRNFTLHNQTNYLTCAVDYSDSSLNKGGTALVSCALSPTGVVGSLFVISTNGYSAIDGKMVPDYDPTGVIAPALLADSELYGCWGGTYTAVWLPYSIWVGFWRPNLSDPPGPTNLFGEPNTFSADGGSLNYYRIWRALNGATTSLYQSISTNGGRTWYMPQPADWTFPEQTTIPNAPSETTGLRLSDGRYVIVGNPQSGGAGCGTNGRDPLFLALSDTGSTTITNVYAVRQGLSGDGTFIGTAQMLGGAQYPSAVQVGNYLYISYSIAKQRVGFSRRLIPGLADNNNDVWPPKTTLNIGTLSVGTLRTAGTNAAGTAPTISGQPESVTCITNSTASFYCTAAGTAPLSYQWSLAGTNVTGATASSWSYANVPAQTNTVFCGVTNAYGGLASSSVTLTVTNGVASSYLVSEDFETGMPGWTIKGSTIKTNFTPYLEGNYSLMVLSQFDDQAFKMYSAPATNWTYMLFKCGPGAAGEQCQVMHLWDANSNEVAKILVDGDGTLSADQGSATTSTATANVVTSNSLYMIWTRYVAGSGANGILDIYVGTNSTTRPASPTVSCTTGTSTNNAAGIDFEPYPTRTNIIDHVRVSASEIGSNPP